MKKFKRLWCTMLALIMVVNLISNLSVPVHAETLIRTVDESADSGTALDAFEYVLDETERTVTLTKYIGTDTAVVIPDCYTVEGFDYQPVLDSSTLFLGNTTITSVAISAGAEYKDGSMSYLFRECSKLTDVDLSDVDTSSVTDMSYLFYKCTALTAIDLEGLDTENVTTMRGMFSYCTRLSSLSGYENWDTSSLESMYHMFNRVASASGAGTLECIDLTNWDLDQVTNNGWCFQLCYAEQILLPDNLSVMSAGFLNHAAKVTGISYTIPAGVKKIGYAHTIYDFATNDFVEFVVADGNTNYKAVDGILYSADGTEMLAVPRNKTFEDGIYQIPEGVSFLGELSFSRNYNIHTLVLPDSYEIKCVPLYDPEYIVFEDVGNLNAGTNLSIAIYCYTGITQYQVKETNTKYASLNGIIYSKDMTEVVAIPARYAQEIVIPEGVTNWNKEAMWADFENNSANTLANLLSNCSGVSIPTTLRTISDDQLAMLNLLYTMRAGSDNPFTITIADGNQSFELDDSGNLCRTNVDIFSTSDNAHSISIDPDGTILFDGVYTLTQNGTKLTGKIGSDNKSVTFYQLNDNTYILASAVSYTQDGNTEYLYEYTGFYLDYVDALKVETMVMKYDDHLDVADKTVEIIDAGTPTSYQVGYGVEENTILDNAVVMLEEDVLVATGIGTAKVCIDGQLYEITVEAAPISLLLLIGQSNMQGSEGNANQSIICEDGQVYATYGDRYSMTIDNSTNYAASALTGDYASINVNGTTTDLEGYPIYTLNEAGSGKAGPDSGFAYQWAKATGEKVWVVNAAHGGSSITTWQVGGANYEEAVALFGACQETLKQEIAAGHYTLSHMGYFWCQGAADEQQTAEWYVEKFLAMHDSLKKAFSIDMDSDPETPNVTLEFGNIIAELAGHVGKTGYRYNSGTYDSTDSKFLMSYEELEMRGHRVAQRWMASNPELKDINMVSNLGEIWIPMPDGSDGVEEYFASHYDNGTVDYTTQVLQSDSWYTPTVAADVKDSIHYNQIGFNEVGIDAARNALYLLGEIPEPDVETTVTFCNWTGYEEITSIPSYLAGCSDTLVVPMVSPCYKSKQITYEVSEGLEYNYFDLIDTTGNGGTLTARIDGANPVVVNKYEEKTYLWECEDDIFSSIVNDTYSENGLTAISGSITDGIFSNTVYKLDNTINLKHDNEWYIEWTMSGDEKSILLASMQTRTDGLVYLYRNSNAIVCIGNVDNGSHNYGLRLSDYGIDYSAEHTYRIQNVVSEDGNMPYLFVDGEPLGPMTNHYLGSTLQDSNNNYLSGKDFVFSYIGNSSYPLNNISVGYLEVSEDGTSSDYHVHEYSNWEVVSTPSADALGLETRTCSSCGYIQERDVEGVWQKYDLADHLVALPDEICKGTNLWPVLAHDEYYFTSSNAWNIHSSKNVYSVTIPVSEGDQICASSFGKCGENGHSSSNGIRVTFFDAYGVCKTLSSEETYAEFSANGYLTAPEGAVAINVPMWTNSDAWELYILSKDHEYSGTACIICNETHPNVDNYSGKVISILSASTSTFAGYIPVADGFNLEHRARYPQDNLLTDVNDTWWMQVITELDAKLGINDSWAGSQVLNTIDGNSGDLGEDAALASLTRIQNLGSNGTPDVILFLGGGNDIGRGVTLGSFDPKTAPTDVDLTSTKWDSFADAYVTAIMRLQYFYPDTKIVVMLYYEMPSYVTAAKLDKYGDVIKAICEHYEVPYIELQDCGITYDMLPDGIHPNAEGMDYITADVLQTLLSECEMEAGENVVYSVTHNLTNAKSSRGYYKGVSDGESYETTISGEDVVVEVTMDGVDITNDVYADGVVSISNVSGDVVITAKGKYDIDGHLQQLPDNICSNTNLWTLLEPENIYYTANGWGLTGAGNQYSVTIPVNEGDQIWATSFGTKQTNGFAANGVRMTWFLEDGVIESMSREDVYGEFAENGYLTAPEGAVAANIPMASSSDAWELYILNAPHEYSGTACIICNETHPNVDNYSGKVISILGDSISTFAGYIPVADGFNLEHLARYPQDNLLTDVNETWWMQVISELDAKLGVNDSWRGSSVSGYASVTTGVAGYLAAMSNLTQIQNLGSNGTPDVILFYGGTNDLAHTPKLGSFDPASAPSEVDLTTLKWDNLADAYANTLLRLQHFYPDTQIICLLPTYTASYYSDEKLAQGNTMLANICEHYGVTYVDLRYCGISTADLPDGIHPDATGMDYITNAVLDTLLACDDMTVGENVVYTVTHELENAESSLSYYKGISEGKSFTETLSGENMSVVVTMGGENITDRCYKNGVISIENVTGDIVITVKAAFSLGDHLQALPAICCGTNLWSVLEHDDEYFYIDEWKVHSSGNVYSVTIPVTPGEKIYASSFEAAGVNSGPINGIRITFFSDEGVLTSMEAADVYEAFAENGYVIVPEGAVAVNVPMWTNRDGNELYILNLDHSFIIYINDNNATCTEDGTKTAKCNSCNVTDTVTDIGSATGHKASEEWTVSKEATCTETGSKYHVCENGCAERLDVTEIPAIGHTYGSVVTAPTCTDKGYTTHTCSVCDDSYVDTYTDENGHSYDEWTTVKEATCTEAGNQRRDCATCDYFETEEIAALGHDYEAVVTDLTCTEAGYTTHTCTRCDDSYTDTEVEATGHSYGEWTVVKEATCTEAGSQRRDCANCDHFETEEIAALGHQAGSEWLIEKEASCTETGIKYRECINGCGEKLDVTEIETIDHIYGSVVTSPTCTEGGYTTHTCALCDDSYVDTYTEATGHSFGEWTVEKEATCTETGSQKRGCTNCEHFETEEIGALGHDYEAVVTDPTCTEAGYTTHTCTRCDDSYTDTEVEATGHSYGEWTVVEEATCIEAGSQRRDCANCDHFETEEIVALGHQAGSEWVIEKEASCTETGIKYHECINGCGEKLDATEIETIDHIYGSVVTSPTCTEGGYTTHTCALCDDSYVDTYTEATGHSFGEWTVEKEATCTETGSQKRECADCDYFETEEIVALGHDYEAVVTDPTCTEGGYTTHTCTKCNDSYTDAEVPAIGHKTELQGAKEATCTAEGYAGDKVCTVCKSTVEKGSVIAKKAHTAVTDKAVAATCTTAGKTEGSHCSVCNTVLKAQTDIPATGHKWDSGKITTAATAQKSGVKTYTCTVCKTTRTESVPYEGSVVQDMSVERIWGASRYKTSLAIADELKEELGISQFNTVIIASGTNFPDALAGSYLAAKTDAPILMVQNNADDIALVQNYISKNLKSGGKVYILGGTAAVPESIEKNLKSKGYDVERLKGKGRYDTNLEILKEAGVNNEAILVCTGTNFADSLSASAAGLPILLVDPNTNTLTAAQIAFLDDAKREIYIIGGAGAVSDTYLSALAAYDSDGTVERVKGKSRYETSVEVAKKFCKNPDNAIVASAQNFPDGLCGGPLAYVMDAPLILTNPTADAGKLVPAKTYIADMKIKAGKALGGTGALADEVVRTIFGMGSGDKISGERYN